MNIFYITSQ